MDRLPILTSTECHFAKLRTACQIIITLGAALLLGCTTIVGPNLLPPLFNPPSGTFTAPISVSITDSNSTAAIYYTIDESTPTSSSTRYTAPLSVSASETIEAVAIASGLSSNVSSATYTISIPKTATPVFSPPGGTYAAPQLVTITDSTPGAVIYYTTDGSIPTTTSNTFQGVITVSVSEVISAVALAPGYTLSDIATAIYYIGPTGTNLWTWMGGGSTFAINYGTLGVPSTSNYPPSRSNAASWTDVNGNFWLFGGNSAPGNPGFLNDLWEYNPTTNLWTWQGGSQSSNQPSVHVAAGVADPSNVPCGRTYSSTWIDTSGNLWLFGGNYFIAGGQGTYLNDLWKFDPSTHLWTWYSGNPVQFPVGIYGSQGTPSSTNIPGGRESGISWIDTVGNLWMFGGNGVGNSLSSGALNDLWMYNPSLNQWTWISGNQIVNTAGNDGHIGVTAPTNQPPGTEFAVGGGDTSNHAWVFGGDGAESTPNNTLLNTLWRFDLASREWTWVSGETTPQPPGTYGTIGIPSPLNMPPGRDNAHAWTAAPNYIWIFGGPVAGAGQGPSNDLWRFNPATNIWTWMSGSSTAGAATSFGQLGVPSPTNVPGARTSGVTWIDQSGNLWLFGGIGSKKALNELWRYQP